MVGLLLRNRKNVRRMVKIMNSPAGGKWISYGLGSKMILDFCRSDYARKEYFGEQMQLLDEFLNNVTGIQGREGLIPGIFINNFLKSWRSVAISRMNGREVKKYAEIKGLELFDKAFRQGKGVILLSSHWGYPESSLSIFPLLGYKNFYTIVRERGSTTAKFAGLKEELTPKTIIFKDHSNAELFKTLFKARDVLNSGGIFHILGDGYHGKSSININFLGRIRGFRHSFAELGLTTEAPIVPIFLWLLPDGKIRAQIGEAIDKGDDSMSHQEKVHHIVTQYAYLLEERWKKQPQHIGWGQMERYLRQIDTTVE